MLYFLIDTKDKTEGYCTTDDTSIRNKDQLLKSDAWLVAKELKDLDNTDGSDEAPNNANDEHSKKELPRPVEVNEWEECNTQIPEHESFNSVCYHLEGNWCHCLSLRWKIVPAIFGHDNTWHKKSNNTRVVEELGDTVAKVAKTKDGVDLDHRVYCEKTEFFKCPCTQYTEEDSDHDWAETEKKETSYNLEWCRGSEHRVGSCILINSVEQDNAYGVISNTLTKD